MNVITLASRKGGVGKSTLTAHLAGFAHLVGYRTMVVDADPQGSLTLWHSMRAQQMRGQEIRGQDGLALQNPAQGMNRILASAQLAGYQWALIDTAPTTWVVVQEAIRAATLVLIPVRPGFFDLAAVRETVATARDLGKPYAVVINAAPVKREEKEAPGVALSRAQFDALAIPVWSGQISQRAGFLGSLAAGGSAGEIDGDSACKTEIARLWSAVERSVEAINLAHAGAGGYRAA
jgi:chromosome partitioning protein